MGLDIFSYNLANEAYNKAKTVKDKVDTLQNDGKLDILTQFTDEKGDLKYKNNSIGAITVDDDSTIVSSNVKELNLVGAQITNEGNGKVTVEFIGGGGSIALDVDNFGAKVSKYGYETTLTWKNPTSDLFTKSVLFMSDTLDLTNASFDYCKTNATQVSENVGQSLDITKVVNTVPMVNYYFKIFTVFTLKTNTIYSVGKALTVKTEDKTLPSIITFLNIEQISKNSAKLTWQLPLATDKSFKKLIVVRKIGSFANSAMDGDKIYEGNADNYIDNSMEVGKDYYYKIFTISPCDVLNSGAESQLNFSLDNTIPSGVTSTNITSGYQSLKIKWKGSTSADVKMTTLVRKEGSIAPTNVNDGTQVITVLKADNDKYEVTPYIDGGLAFNTQYSYSWFVIDKWDNVSAVVSANGTTLEADVHETSNLQLLSKDNGTKVSIKYANPTSLNSGLVYVKTRLFYSNKVDLSSLKFDECVAQATELATINNTLGASVNLDLTNVIKDTVYHFKTFIEYENAPNTYHSNGNSSSLLVKDATPLSDITNLNSIGRIDSIDLTWFNPNTALDSDFSLVEIFRKEGAYPTGDNIAERIYNSTNKNAGNMNTFTDTGLMSSKTYYYLFVTTDTSGNKNLNSKIMVNTLSVQAYTTEINKDTPNTFTRKHLSEGKTVDDLLTLAPFNQIKRCVVKDDLSIAYYLNPTNSALQENGQPSKLDGTDGQVMVEIPKFYYYNAYKDGIYTHSISTTAINGYKVHPMFVVNGVEKSKVYVSAFENVLDATTGKFKSIANVKPTYGNLTANVIRNYCARGNGWQSLDKNTLDGIRLLYIVLYGDSNAQRTIGLGVVNDTAIHNTGETVALGNKSGYVGSVNDGKQSLSLMGMENLFGNVGNAFIDGAIISDSSLWLADSDFGSFVDATNTGSYKQVQGYIGGNGTNGYGNERYVLENYSHLFLSKGFTGDSNLGSGDYIYNKVQGLNTYALPYLGLKYNSGLKAGLFAVAYVNTTMNTSTKPFASEVNTADLSMNVCVFSKATDGEKEGNKIFTNLAIDNTSDPTNLVISWGLSASGRMIAKV